MVEMDYQDQRGTIRQTRVSYYIPVPSSVSSSCGSGVVPSDSPNFHSQSLHCKGSPGAFPQLRQRLELTILCLERKSQPSVWKVQMKVWDRNPKVETAVTIFGSGAFVLIQFDIVIFFRFSLVNYSIQMGIRMEKLLVNPMIQFIEDSNRITLRNL